MWKKRNIALAFLIASAVVYITTISIINLSEEENAGGYQLPEGGHGQMLKGGGGGRGEGGGGGSHGFDGGSGYSSGYYGRSGGGSGYSGSRGAAPGPAPPVSDSKVGWAHVAAGVGVVAAVGLIVYVPPKLKNKIEETDTEGDEDNNV